MDPAGSRARGPRPRALVQGSAGRAHEPAAAGPAPLFHQDIPVGPKLGAADGHQRLDAAELSAAGRRAVQAGLRQIERLNQEMAPLRHELARLSSRLPGAGRCAELITASAACCPSRCEPSWATAAGSPPPTTRCGTPAWTSRSTTLTAGARGVTLPGKDRCGGRCTRQRCTHPARPRRTTSASAASGTGSTASARCCRWPASWPAAAGHSTCEAVPSTGTDHDAGQYGDDRRNWYRQPVVRALLRSL